MINLHYQTEKYYQGQTYTLVHSMMHQYWFATWMMELVCYQLGK
ncbi:MAG: hypothetical protein ETSY2_54170 [Candidatus Entotheonella gemina]|uniref:Uncharacterized protein n=1 Tax=Candidatus Entotheonella gemina TaxID=1429439 RepID=W4L286_9BACT|nr:MAG: hypothetical protein ETSY2_54170 [Candidatus Entotheonella gemina]